MSATTIVRLVRRTWLPEVAPPTLLGVDEWAHRKRVQAQRRAQRLARYERVVALYQAGASA
jgi:hypothetical protein